MSISSLLVRPSHNTKKTKIIYNRNNKTFNQLTDENMIQLKNKLSAIATLFVLIVIVASFTDKPFTFDGGTITNPNITITGTGLPVVISATSASGCAGTVTYQWQESIDNVNFIDISNATDTAFQSGPIMMNTHFRRKAICSGGDSAYTNNVATVTVEAP